MTASTPARPASRDEIGALQAALAAEHAAIYGYGVAGAHLTGGKLAAATADWIAHQVARDDLQAMLRSRAAQPVPAAVAYQLPKPVHSAHSAVSLAIYLEERIATAYLGLVAIAAPATRTFGALQLRAAALRAAFWRGGTVAFPGLQAAELSQPPADRVTQQQPGPAG
jgi:Domain of unknown function (DUF4439)